MSTNNSNESIGLILKYFDKSIYKSDLISIIQLISYIPIGLVLVIIRLFLVLVLNVIFYLKPDLKTNSYFIRYTCICLGIHTRYISENTTPTYDANGDDKQIKVYISNHVTCLDYFSIKSVFNNSNYVDYYSKRSLVYRKNNNFLNDLLSPMFIGLLEMPRKKNEREDLFRNKENYPFIFFPELMATNGSYGLLKFDVRPFEASFDGSNANNNLIIQPICLNINRPVIPFSANYLYSNDLINILLTLFCPLTIYDLVLLKEETRKPNESAEQFAERLRALMSSKLSLKNINQLSHSDLVDTWNNFVREERQRLNLPRTYSNSSVGSTLSRNNSENQMSFSDISKLALQIKDILPDVSFETIQSHVRSSTTLDIDTVIASILDEISNQAASEDMGSQASEILTRVNSAPSNLTPSLSSSPPKLSASRSFKSFATSSFCSFEERKFALLNEARQRYLAKHPQH